MALNNEFIGFHYLDILFEMTKSNISLVKAKVQESDTLLAIQKEVFMPLYEKYQDHDISPDTQTMERFIRRFELGDYYKILYKNTLAGSVFVYQKEPGIMRFHIINILKEYQNKGIAQEVMKRLEMMYPQAEKWELETILSEERNCYLYEKMGYIRRGELRTINDKLTLVNYLKNRNLRHICVI